MGDDFQSGGDGGELGKSSQSHIEEAKKGPNTPVPPRAARQTQANASGVKSSYTASPATRVSTPGIGNGRSIHSFLDKTITFDWGSRGMPPTLTIGACEKGQCSMQHLIDTWHEHSGMRTCFHEAAELLCIHLDRLTRNSSGAVDWEVSVDPYVLLPIWNDSEGLTLHFREYVPVSLVLHSGTTSSGHLQAALQTSQVVCHG